MIKQLRLYFADIKKMNVISIMLAVYSILHVFPGSCLYISFFPAWELVYFAALIIVSLKNRSIFNFKNKGLPLFSIVFIFWNICSLFFVGTCFIQESGVLISFISLFLFFSLKDEDKRNTINVFVVFSTILFTFSAIEFIFYLFGEKFLIAQVVERGEGTTAEFEHGIFNLYDISSWTMRFQGLFREPGHLGVCAGLMLFAYDKLDKKIYYLWMIFGILSQSLAFFILLFIAIVYRLFSSRRGSAFISAIILVCALSVIIIKNRDLADLLIFERIESYQSKGYDSRSTEELNSYISKLSFSNQPFGYGDKLFVSKELSWGNTGIKADIFKYGYAGVLLIIISVISLLSFQKDHKTRLLCIFLFLLCYYNGDIKYSLFFYFALLTNYFESWNH